jgi:cell division protein FtsQ
MLPQLLARNAQPLQRADLRYTNGFALSWGEPGIGSGESGIGEAALASQASVTSIGQIRNSVTLLFSIPHSPFPIPGLTS